jgi:hypothetical protein
MDIKRALPRPELRSVVRSFEERRADLGSAVLTWPVAARPHQILRSCTGRSAGFAPLTSRVRIKEAAN